MNKTILLCAMMIMFVPYASANDLRTVVHLRSYHVSDRSFNENNIGLGIEWGHRALQGTTGAYRNSVNNLTVYAGVTWPGVEVVPHLRVGMEAAIVTGYYVPVLPAAALTLRVWDRVKIDIIPKTKWNPITFGLSLTLPHWEW